MVVLDAKDFEVYVKSPTPLIVKFFSMWNPDSRTMEEPFMLLSEELQEKARFMEVNANLSPEVVQKYRISKIPCVAIFHLGELVKVIPSFPSKRVVREIIEDVLVRFK